MCVNLTPEAVSVREEVPGPGGFYYVLYFSRPVSASPLNCHTLRQIHVHRDCYLRERERYSHPPYLLHQTNFPLAEKQRLNSAPVCVCVCMSSTNYEKEPLQEEVEKETKL